MSIAETPKPPYYVAIFSSFGLDTEVAEQAKAAEEMFNLAAQQAGFLGYEYGNPLETGFSLFVSYWRSDEDIRAWKQVARHLEIQDKAKAGWYGAYRIRVAKVERDYGR